MAERKRGLGIDVLTAARERISRIFDDFPRIYVSFSGGKDSTVMLHLVMEEAIKRGRRDIGVLFIDLEGQYKLTIDHVAACYERYRDWIEPHWVALPIHLRNGVSVHETHWLCWDPDQPERWIRPDGPPAYAITDEAYYPFFVRGMEFEEFTPAFGHWFAQDQPCACFVGIRTDESLNRWRTIAGGRKQMLDDHPWTTWCGDGLYNAYPLYDWRTEDLWTYHARYPELPYNRLYDRMYQAGLTIHQARICQPYGDDQRKGLWLFHIIEPETWARIVARVDGVNGGALYARESGSINGVRGIQKPPNHTWQSFAELLLESMPPKTADHYRDKIAVFIRWWQQRDFEYGENYSQGIPDELPARLESGADGPGSRRPSWRRICKMLLRNDYWAKGLSFSQTKSETWERYKKIMKRRRAAWGIYG